MHTLEMSVFYSDLTHPELTDFRTHCFWRNTAQLHYALQRRRQQHAVTGCRPAAKGWPPANHEKELCLLQVQEDTMFRSKYLQRLPGEKHRLRVWP